MKKIILGLMVLVTLSLGAVDITGGFNYGFITNLTNFNELASALSLSGKAKINDNVNVTFGLSCNNASVKLSSLVLNQKWNDLITTAIGYSGAADGDIVATLTINKIVTTLTANIDFTDYKYKLGVSYDDVFVLGGSFNLNGKKDFLGILAGNGGIKFLGQKISGDVSYDLSTNALTYDIIGALTYSIITDTITFNGSSTKPIDNFTNVLNLALDKNYGVDIACKLVIEPLKLDVEGSGWLNVNGVKYRVGYIYTDSSYSSNALISATNGGVFGNITISF